MPIICEFWGLKNFMYYQEHLPPYLHVRGAGARAILSIPEGTLLGGKLPPGTASQITKWVRDNAEAIMENWWRAYCKEPLLKVPPPK